MKAADVVSSRFSKAVLYCAVAAIASEVPMGFAQGSQERAGTLEEVIVSARKVNESLQDVPLSINAYSRNELLRANVTGLNDLARITPGLAFDDLNGAYQAPVIRGLGQLDQLALNGNVGVFLDGVFLDNRSGLEFGVMDIERIEVVKGPQSALYGRNTFAGAINYVTKDPNPEEFEGRIEGTVGTYGRWGVEGSVNVPLGDNLALYVFGGDSAFDGTIDNIRTGEEIGGYDKRQAFGGSLLWQPTNRMRLKLFGVYNEMENDQPPLSVISGPGNNCGATADVSAPGEPPRILSTLFCGPVPYPSSVNLSPQGFGNVGDSELMYLNFSYDFDFATLTFQASHSESEFSTAFDAIGDPDAVNRPFLGGFTQQLFTNSAGDKGDTDAFELRLASSSDSRLQWLLGVSYTDLLQGAVLGSTAPLVADPTGAPQPVALVTRRLSTEASAIFGSVTFDVTDKLTLGAEVRYTEEEQDITGETNLIFLGLVLPGAEGNAEFDFVTPRFTFEYEVNPDFMLYGSAARGVKTGGFNVNGVGSEFFTYDEEYNWTYEVGFRSSLFEDRATVNVTAFYIDWEDLQINSASGLPIGNVISNNGDATSQGLEFEGSFLVTPNFEIRTGFAVMAPEYGDDVIDGELLSPCGLTDNADTLTTCDAAVGGNQIARTSDANVFLSGTYTLPNVFGSVFDGYIRADYSHQAARFVLGDNASTEGDIDLTNLRIGISSPKLEVALWADNLFDEDWVRRTVKVQDTAANANCQSRGADCGVTLTRIYPGDKRVIGVTATYRF